MIDDWSTSRGVDVTYVKRGQVAAIVQQQPAQQSQRAKAATARAIEARKVRQVPKVGEVKDVLSRLDGSNRAAVSLLTGFSNEELDDLGGFAEDGA